MVLYEPVILLADREANFKPRALAGLAHNQDLSVVPCNDAVRGGKTKATSVFALGGEKWFEDS